jgi:hypothetical protein
MEDYTQDARFDKYPTNHDNAPQKTTEKCGKTALCGNNAVRMR